MPFWISHHILTILLSLFLFNVITLILKFLSTFLLSQQMQNSAVENYFISFLVIFCFGLAFFYFGFWFIVIIFLEISYRILNYSFRIYQAIAFIIISAFCFNTFIDTNTYPPVTNSLKIITFYLLLAAGLIYPYASKIIYKMLKKQSKQR